MSFGFAGIILSKHMPRKLRLQIKDILLKIYSVEAMERNLAPKYHIMYELKIAEELAIQVEKLKPVSLNLLRQVLLVYMCGNIFCIICVGIEFAFSSRIVSTKAKYLVEV